MVVGFFAPVLFAAHPLATRIGTPGALSSVKVTGAGNIHPFAREGNDNRSHVSQTVCNTPPTDYDAVGVSAGVYEYVTQPYSVAVFSSPYGGEPPYSFAWSFGATTQVPVYDYSSNGPQFVSVTATDCDGESGSASFWFWGFTYGAFWVPPISTEAIAGVRGSPHLSSLPALSPSASRTFLVGEELSFNATAQSTNSTVSSTSLTYHWTFGDGSSIVGAQGVVNHTYTAPGTYLVNVNVTAPGGYWTSDSISLIVSTQVPALRALASVSYEPGPYPLSVNFSSGGTTGGNPPYSYMWEFGDGSNSTSGSPNHVYTSPGTYYVSLEVTDSSGNTSYSNLTLSLHHFFSVTYMEVGLPSGESWSMTVNGSSQSSVSSAIQFGEPNGTSPYSVGAVPGYTASPPSGYVTVAGAAIAEVIRFTSTPLTFTSTTIPVGDNPDFATYDPGNGYMYMTNEGSNSTSILNGTAVIATVPAGDSPTYALYDPANGYEYITNSGFYSSTGTVSILNGTALVRTVPVGANPFSAAYDAVDGYVYVPNFGSSSVSVLSGTTVVATLPVGSYPSFVAYDPGTGYVYVPNEGTGTNSSVSVLSGTTVVATVPVGIYPYFVLYDPADGYVYVLDYGSTSVSVLNGLAVVASVPIGTGASGAVLDAKNGDVYILHQASNLVNVLNGTTVIATVPVGLYPYGAAYDNADGMVYIANSGSNTVSVMNGTAVEATVAVGSAPVSDGYDPADGYVYVTNFDTDSVTALGALTRYATSFTESGLPSGTEWWVNVTGQPAANSLTSTITLSLPNGSYTYAVSTALKTYHASGGSFTVNGGPVSQAVTFAPVAYTVTFTESGLPSGTSWSAALNGATQSSVTSTIAFSEPNGTYSFTMSSPDWQPHPGSGKVTVNGTSQAVAITFTQVTYTVTFTETGLPSGTNWSVSLGLVPTTRTSTTSTITLPEPNGTYDFTVWAVAGYTTSPSSGSVTVNGAAVTQAITFTSTVVTTYTVAFTETGLPSGTTWAVTLNGTTQSASTGSMVFTEPGGTYAYTIGSVPGYTVSPPSGSVTVAGRSQNVAVAFTASSSGGSSSGFLGLSGNTGYYVVGGIGAALGVGIAAVAALRLRRR